ncbi:hypothetical protein DP067_02955 [Mycoplasmopsis anatis]|uniref:Uncharacterized protein n=2 Tax=Mycoplasmopsis anatis TaxID=171279 RepID=F9QEF4_9BACT|nr:hypothetical protein [Mycoplasmopsis anatis]AWX70299.1 hypothetical protein DP067_02955 [Mycoplasmopsis anatis]EGS28881.1 hypothetical protein GIG_03849 [Mycoplasmopsis anatis 1340]MBW0596288.1 hypothetical protein [Mycoplasmopsis anatis]MBW0596462.1 hypothetical protein [Mycoplasmopsis anatis]MBW0597787.1 hypothetical protein [Mycoplasmopsis anatis]
MNENEKTMTKSQIIKNIVETNRLGKTINEIRKNGQCNNSLQYKLPKDFEVNWKNEDIDWNWETEYVKFILKNMSKINSMIIEKTYIQNNNNSKDKNWYKDYFSKTTFYKKKKQAELEFLTLYFASRSNKQHISN